MNIQFSSKKIDGVFEGVLIVDGKFSRSGSGRTAAELFTKFLVPILMRDQEDGAEAVINAAVLSALEVSRAEKREAINKATEEARMSAEETEKLNAEQKREAAANAESSPASE